MGKHEIRTQPAGVVLMHIYKSDLQIPVEAIIEEIVPQMIATAVHEAKQEVYREIADSLKSAGEIDLYRYHSMEDLAAMRGCDLAGQRVSWLVEE